MVPKGAHRFGGSDAPSVELPPSVACVLHFEASTFELWRAKFSALGRRHASAAGHGGPEDGSNSEGPGSARAAATSSAPKIPFAYYRESMAAARALDAAQAQGPAALEAAMDAARQLWARWKQAPPELPGPPAARAAPLVLREHGVTLLKPLGWTCDSE